ncbi:MAG: TIR domain-containing protein [Pseudonocardiaceae bacterium]
MQVARVFLSHASEDIALARDVRGWVVEAGHEVFLARDLGVGIPAGEPWRQRLHERLRWADAVVCVATSAYLASTWCAAEIAIAQSRGIELLPVLDEPGAVHPLLTDVQHIDLNRNARAALVEALGQVGWPDGRSPFPGLRSFDVAEHRVFFGRADEVRQLAERLRSPDGKAKSAALLVVGPSGCGKSSLVRAGLLHVMADEPGWRALPPILPGADPVMALARELAGAAREIGLDWTVEQVRHRLDEGNLTALADELLLAAPGGPLRRLLIVVDQCEELLTQTGPEDRARFAELLRSALTGPVRVVGTLRSEFHDQLLGDPALASLPRTIYSLPPLGREALRLVIEGPARLAGIGVEDQLVARLVDDTGGGEALPLLAFTLAQLADGVSRGGRLSAGHYNQLGGVSDALIGQADAAVKDATAARGRSLDEVIDGLLWLVTVDERGRPTRLRVFRDELPDLVAADLDEFVARRLLTTDSDNGRGVIGVAHETFLSAWPPLAAAIKENASALRARRSIEHAATAWNDNGRPANRLWGGGALAAALADTGVRDDLSTLARSFRKASIRRDRNRRRLITTVLSVLLILALAAAGLAVVQQRAAQEQQRIATARQLLAQSDAIRAIDPRTALQLGIAAQRIHAGGDTQSSLVNTLTTTRYAGTLTVHGGPVSAVAFAPVARILAIGTREGVVTLWDLSNRAEPRQLGQPLTGHHSLVSAVAFAPDGRTLATGSYDGTAILWDLTDPTQPQPRGRPLTGHRGLVTSVAFAPDGRTLATGSADGTVMLWDLTDPAHPQPRGQPLTSHPLPGHRGEVTSVAFAPDGRTLATGSDDGTAILWDLTNSAHPWQPLTGHRSLVSSVAFAPDGRTLATGSDDGTAILWDLTNPAQPRQLGQPLSGHLGQVTSVVFTPDGHTLATGSDDGTAILWDLTNLARPRQLGQPLSGHLGQVTSVAFAADGHTLATGSDDGTAILWSLDNSAQPRQLGQPLTGHHSLVSDVAFADDGHTLLTSSSDGTTIRWDLTNPAQPQLRERSPTHRSRLVPALEVSRDGKTQATVNPDGTVSLWDLTDRARPRRLGQPLSAHTNLIAPVVFAPDGSIVATASDDGTVILWDLADRARPQRLGETLTGPANLVISVAFAADGRTVATGSADGTVILWDLTDRARPQRLGQPLTGHTSSVNSLMFAPDGNILATGSSDGTVILWDLTRLNDLRNHAAERACSLAGRGLNAAEWVRYVLGMEYRTTCPPDDRYGAHS